MQQAKFSLTKNLIEFVGDYKRFGFKDKSAMVRAALIEMQEQMQRRQLELSADLYAEIYEEDEEVRELVEMAIDGWPE